ncbi:hypothetical protein RchiOBHm_Chr2g0131571 [Rosa chinensis]|uniref:Uncharacterized protein n=1 Tax=Rosa chinensis TaxID=74649 RepID=A0A2P6RV43_ROSCH|nr:hypothetical protein RchiOBHm_Chr2g0131571 [Rosa chinensis]
MKQDIISKMQLDGALCFLILLRIICFSHCCRLISDCLINLLLNQNVLHLPLPKRELVIAIKGLNGRFHISCFDNDFAVHHCKTP